MDGMFGTFGVEQKHMQGFGPPPPGWRQMAGSCEQNYEHPDFVKFK